MSTPKPTGPPFVEALHGLRGVAASMVFIGHSVGGYLEHLVAHPHPFFEGVRNLGTFGVEIFFVLSGYVIYQSASRSEPTSFAHRRFWRIYPLFAFITLLYVTLNATIGHDPSKQSIAFLVPNLLFVDLFLSDVPSLAPNAWTISYEIWFYLLTFTTVYGKRIGRPLLWVPSLLLSGLFLYRYPISLFYVWGVCLSIGIQPWRQLLHKSPSWAINALQIIALVIVVGLGAQNDYVYRWDTMLDGQPLMLMTALMVFIGCLFHPQSLTARMLSHHWILPIGTMSYTLYLAHPYSYIVARKSVEILTLIDRFGGMAAATVFAVLNIGLTVAVVRLTYRWIEEYPYVWATGRPIYRRKTIPPRGH